MQRPPLTPQDSVSLRVLPGVWVIFSHRSMRPAKETGQRKNCKKLVSESGILKKCSTSPLDLRKRTISFPRDLQQSQLKKVRQRDWSQVCQKCFLSTTKSAVGIRKACRKLTNSRVLDFEELVV